MRNPWQFLTLSSSSSISNQDLYNLYRVGSICGGQAGHFSRRKTIFGCVVHRVSIGLRQNCEGCPRYVGLICTGHSSSVFMGDKVFICRVSILFHLRYNRAIWLGHPVGVTLIGLGPVRCSCRVSRHCVGLSTWYSGLCSPCNSRHRRWRGWYSWWGPPWGRGCPGQGRGPHSGAIRINPVDNRVTFTCLADALSIVSLKLSSLDEGYCSNMHLPSSHGSVRGPGENEEYHVDHRHLQSLHYVLPFLPL